MGNSTPAERRLAGQIAAATRWGNTVDRTAATQPARDALTARFEREVPAEITDPRARAQAADSLRRAHYRRLALASAKARRQAREQTDVAAAAEAALSELGDLG